jgi:hypothetical protein
MGEDWGENGYARIASGINVCDIETKPAIPANISDTSIDLYKLFRLHPHDIEKTGAMCIDGTHTGVYFSPGWGDGRDKVVISMQGGGWGEGLTPDLLLENLYNRSMMNFGSSKSWSFFENYNRFFWDDPK